MVDSSGHIENPAKPRTLSRRETLRMVKNLSLELLAMGVLGACAKKEPEPQIQTRLLPQPQAQPAPAEAAPAERVPAPEPTVSPQTQQLIQEGRNLVTAEDRAMFRETTPGLDLPFFRNATAQTILRIPDLRQRILAAVGFLDVEKNPQYNSGVYSCNLYALTLSRLLLSDDAIGSRYARADGTPWVVARNDGQVNWADENSIKAFNRNYPVLEGNNIDSWLSTHGAKRGWQTADVTLMSQMMKSGSHIALAVDSTAYVQEEQRKVQEKLAKGEAAEPFSGHIAVFVPGGKPGEFGVTQATNNHTFRPLDLPKDRLFAPQYRYYLHEVPQKSWIDARMGK